MRPMIPIRPAVPFAPESILHRQFRDLAVRRDLQHRVSARIDHQQILFPPRQAHRVHQGISGNPFLRLAAGRDLPHGLRVAVRHVRRLVGAQNDVVREQERTPFDNGLQFPVRRYAHDLILAVRHNPQIVLAVDGQAAWSLDFGQLFGLAAGRRHLPDPMQFQVRNQQLALAIDGDAHRHPNAAVGQGHGFAVLVKPIHLARRTVAGQQRPGLVHGHTPDRVQRRAVALRSLEETGQLVVFDLPDARQVAVGDVDRARLGHHGRQRILHLGRRGLCRCQGGEQAGNRDEVTHRAFGLIGLGGLQG